MTTSLHRLIPTRHRQFVTFVVAGGLAAAVNVGVRSLLGLWLDYGPSIVLAYIAGMITAFVLNRMFVFSNTSNRLHRQVAWFTAINLIAVLQTLVVSFLFAKYIFPAIGFRWHAELIGHTIGVVIPVVTSYLGHKHLSFRQVDP
jgi:putative flippase GtrA